MREYRALALGRANAPVELDLIPDFSAAPPYEEVAFTFAENAAGKALHYSRFSPGLVLADDSGLVVPALGGAPGVHSARYATGPNACVDAGPRPQISFWPCAARRAKSATRNLYASWRLPKHGEARGVFSASAEGELLEAAARAARFWLRSDFSSSVPWERPTRKFPARKKNLCASHRGKAFRKGA